MTMRYVNALTADLRTLTVRGMMYSSAIIACLFASLLNGLLHH